MLLEYCKTPSVTCPACLTQTPYIYSTYRKYFLNPFQQGTSVACMLQNSKIPSLPGVFEDATAGGDYPRRQTRSQAYPRLQSQPWTTNRPRRCHSKNPARRETAWGGGSSWTVRLTGAAATNPRGTIGRPPTNILQCERQFGGMVRVRPSG